MSKPDFNKFKNEIKVTPEAKERIRKVAAPESKLEKDVYHIPSENNIKGKSKIKYSFAAAIAACVVLVMTASLLTIYIKSNIKNNPAESSYVAATDNTNLNSIRSEEGITNILLVGTDASNNNERGRSDSIIIATIDTKHNKLKLTSILRDTWVLIPGTDNKGMEYGWNRINAAYSYGDASLLMDAIAYNFNIELEKYIIVNQKLFSEIIDNIGGLELNISEDEALYLREREEAGENRVNVKTGLNTLDGKLALEFARARHAETFTYTDYDGENITVNNDFARSARQRYVMESIFNKIKNKDMATLLSIAEDGMRSSRTNITLAELAGYVSDILEMKVDEVSQLQIPYKNKYEDVVMESASKVLLLSMANMKANADKMEEFIFEK